jgi:hypothetical protein
MVLLLSPVCILLRDLSAGAPRYSTYEEIRAFANLSPECKLVWVSLWTADGMTALSLGVEVTSALLPTGKILDIALHGPQAPVLPNHLTLSDDPMRLWLRGTESEIAWAHARFEPGFERGVPGQNPPCPFHGVKSK